MTLEDLYARIPKIECRQRCQEACGPIAMTPVEYRRIVAALGFEPDHKGSLNCPVLCPVSGACNAYEARPLICRLWGTVPKMRCPWGCVPERWLTEPEIKRLFADYRALTKNKHVMFPGLLPLDNSATGSQGSPTHGDKSAGAC